MRSQKIHASTASGDDGYRAKPECISVLAPSLGLDRGTSPEGTKAAVLELLDRARGKELSSEAQDAARLIALATAPEPGHLDFLDVRLVSIKGDVRTVGEVKNAVTRLRDALNAQTTNEAAQRSPPSWPRQGVTRIAELIPQVLERTVDKRVEVFEKALRYLQANRIIAPSADESSPPTPEVTQTLAKHDMVWKWNSKTASWDPRLDTRKNQSLFTAAPKYLETIALKGDTERDTFIRSIRNARSVEDNPAYRAAQPTD